MMNALFARLLLLLLTISRCLARQAPDPDLQLTLFDEAAPSFRQNVCDRQAAFSAGNVTMALALEGLELQTVMD